jgi:hypothetical protein
LESGSGLENDQNQLGNAREDKLLAAGFWLLASGKEQQQLEKRSCTKIRTKN